MRLIYDKIFGSFLEKSHFRNEVLQSNEEISQFKVNSQWNPPKGHRALEAFLNKTEKDIFLNTGKREGLQFNKR